MERPRFLQNPWWVVAGSVIALTFGGSTTMLFTNGIFLKPVSSELGWSRASISVAYGIASIASALALPLCGRLIDRIGVQRVVLCSIVLFCASFASVPLGGGSWILFALSYGALGAVASGHSPLPYSKLVTATFDARRGIALGITNTGVGLGGVIIPLLTRGLIDAVGWRWAYVGVAAVVFVVAFPTVALLLKDRDVPSQAKQQSGVPLPGIGVRAALFGSHHFLFIAAAVFLASLALTGSIAHFVALLTDRGYSEVVAASVLGALGVSTIAGRLIVGTLFDRWFAPRVAAAVFLVPAIGATLLALAAPAPAPLIAAVLIGIGLGAEADIIGYMIGRYFGLRGFGEIYGYLLAIFAAGSALGPVLMGLSFDRLHSYGPALAGCVVVLLAAAAAILQVGPYRYPSHAPGA